MEIRETLLHEMQVTAKRSSLEQKSQEGVIGTKNKMTTRKTQVRRTTELWKKLRKDCSQNIQENMGKTRIQPQTEQRKNRGSAPENKSSTK